VKTGHFGGFCVLVCLVLGDYSALVAMALGVTRVFCVFGAFSLTHPSIGEMGVTLRNQRSETKAMFVCLQWWPIIVFGLITCPEVL
jgi:hypothetical protein